MTSFTPGGAYVVLRVQDMNRALAFWRDGLGFKERFQLDVLSEVELNGTVVVLQPGRDGEYRRSSLGLEVSPDIDAAVAAVLAGGGSVKSEPQHVVSDLYQAIVVDTEGNGFQMTSHQER